VGGTLGAVVGAAIAGLLIRPIGIYGLLLVAVVFLLASLGVTRLVHHRERARGVVKSGHEEEDDAEHGIANKDAPLRGKNGFALILQDRYLLLVAALLFILNCVNTNGEYILDRSLVAHLKATIPAGVNVRQWTGEHIGIFKAQYFFYVNTATVLLQLFAVSRVIKYFGVRAGILLSPLVSLVGYSTAFCVPVLGVIFAVKICENTLDYSLQNTAKQALWLLTARDEKYKAKSVCDSFVVRSGDFVSAAITFAGTALGFATRHFILVNMVLVGAWLVIGVLLSRRHGRREARLEREKKPVS
jgi:AAA family ATP:ADP antiporter